MRFFKRQAEIKVSVIMPVYNQVEYLRESLGSALGQTLRDIEVICVDDGSTDGSSELLDELSSTDNRIIVVHQENRGAGPARNCALERARGRFISFLDSDDRYPAPDTLEMLFDAAVSHGVKVSAGYRMALVGESLEEPGNDPILELSKENPDGLMVEYAQVQTDYFYQAYLYDRELIRSNGFTFPDYRRYQDPPFFVAVMAEAQRFYLTSKCSYVYRNTSGRIEWRGCKVVDTAKGLLDVLAFSRDKQLAKLHATTLWRIEENCARILVSDVRLDDLETLRLLLAAESMVDWALVQEGDPDRLSRPKTVKTIDSYAKALGEKMLEAGLCDQESIIRCLEHIMDECVAAADGRIDRNRVSEIILWSLVPLFGTDRPFALRKAVHELSRSDWFAAQGFPELLENDPNLKGALKAFKRLDFAFDFAESLVERDVDDGVSCLKQAELTAVPKVSVIVPVWNTEKYLRKCLDGLVAQTLGDIEIICVDDGSTDGSLAILMEYAGRHRNITILTQPHRGASAARNLGMSHAHGEYIHFHDSDDSIMENAYEVLYSEAVRDGLDMLCFDVEAVYEDRALEVDAPPYKARCGSDELMGGEEYYAREVRSQSLRPEVFFYLIRRDFLVQSGVVFPHGLLHEDNYFTNACILLSRRIRHLSFKAHRRLVRHGSIMTSEKGFANSFGLFECYRLLRDFAREHPLGEEALEALQTTMFKMMVRAKNAHRKIGDSSQLRGYLGLPSSIANEYYMLVARPAELYKALERERKAKKAGS